jgi:ABC-type dipeptide/oligopeptide/nickel transport system permease component
MAQFIVRRLLVSVVVFFVITLGLFGLVHAAPGDPVSMMIPPASGVNRLAFIVAKRHELGLDRALPIQFVLWLGRAVTGNLGYSYQSGQLVNSLLLARLPPTLELMGLGLLVSVVLSIPLGIVSALYRESWIDRVIGGTSIAAIGVPGFFLAMVGIYVFALRLRVLPSSGMTTPGASSTVDALKHLVLPVLTLAFGMLGPLCRYVRRVMVDELGKDYLRTVEAKGGSRARVSWHAFRNGLLPLITVIMVYIPQLLGGAVVLEQIFGWPGMGQLSINAIDNNDYPVIIGFGLYVAILVVACNFLADVAYAFADPRVRLS